MDDHPTVGELRIGNLPLYITDPMKMHQEDEDYYIGEIKVTEVESFIPNHQFKIENGKSEKEFEIGYGICYGQNESKAISMSILDQCLNRKE